MKTSSGSSQRSSGDTLASVTEFIADCEHKTAPLAVEGYPSIRTPNVGRGRLILDGVNRVDEDTYLAWTRRAEPRAGDIILAREAPVGNVALLPPGLKVCLGQRTVLIRPDPKKVNAQYLTYLLLAPEIQNRFRSQSQGATVPHLNLGDIRALHLPKLPPRPTQDRIADILSAYDDLSANNMKRIQILDEMVRSLYREWFVELRFPGHAKATFAKLPKGWEIETIGARASFINRGVPPRYDDQGPGLVINQKCIRDQRLSLEPARRHATKVPAEKLVQRYDVLINSTGVGTLGRVTQVMHELESCTVDTHVTIVRPGPRVRPHFWGQALLAKEVHFESQGAGATGQTELARTRIAETPLLVPPEELQARFDQVVRPLREAAHLLLAKQRILQEARDLLLPRLIGGEITFQ